MALIGTLRTKMTKWVVGGIALAMGAFIVGGDLFGNGPRSIFSGDKNSVGEINGHTVSGQEFQNILQERESSYAMNFGRQAGEREQVQLRQEAWELLILKYGIMTQFDKVGSAVSPEEEQDMVFGKNIDPTIKSSFLDSSGTFNRGRLIQYLQSLDQQGNEAGKARWMMFRSSLSPGRARVKYENLMIKTSYTTTAEAERDYHAQNDVAEVKYLYVPFYAVSDSAVKVSDSDLSAYYNAHKERYKTEQTRSLSYVMFPVSASKADSAASLADFEKTAAGFKATTEDSSYAVAQTDGQSPYGKYNIKTLPKFLSDDKSRLVQGMTWGPFVDGDVYKIIKVVSIGKDTVSVARASHILIKWDNETPEAKKAAKEKAQKILSEIKKGADFAAKAREFGTDGTAPNGGDLGFFPTGQMVKPFENAVFAAKKTGVLNELTETQFGYHIIEVTAVKDNTSYTIATIERTIVASDNTRDKEYRSAELFISDVKGVDQFKEKAKKENLTVFDANDVAGAERRINNLGEARPMISWLFKDASEGAVSSVFDINDNYVVAVMTGETSEGYKALDKVKDVITPVVKNELKGKMLVEKLSALKGSLDEIAKAYGPEAVVRTSADLKENSTQLPGVGSDPTAIGVAFSLENGKTSKPFVGETGVLIMETQTKTIAPGVGDYSMFKQQLQQASSNMMSMNITEALKEAFDIKDKRYKFY